MPARGFLAVIAAVAWANTAAGRDLQSADIYSADHPTVQATARVGQLVEERSAGRHRLVVLGEENKSSEAFIMGQLRNVILDMARLNLASLANMISAAPMSSARPSTCATCSIHGFGTRALGEGMTDQSSLRLTQNMTASATSIANVATTPAPIAQIMMSCHNSAICVTGYIAYRLRIEGGGPIEGAIASCSLSRAPEGVDDSGAQHRDRHRQRDQWVDLADKSIVEDLEACESQQHAHRDLEMLEAAQDLG